MNKADTLEVLRRAMEGEIPIDTARQAKEILEHGEHRYVGNCQDWCEVCDLPDRHAIHIYPNGQYGL